MTEPFDIATDDVVLGGDLTQPADALGVVVFAHGSGSSRHSARNQAVARSLQDDRYATLLFDLLDPAEDQADQAGKLRFDIGLLAQRLVAALTAVQRHGPTAQLPIGLFGASTGAAAALSAATLVDSVTTVVSRGGRPDLAGDALRKVTVPTLLIVGGNDTEVLGLNEYAGAQLGGEYELKTVEGASHLFEEQGALAQVAELARHWFNQHLVRTA